MMHAVSPGRYFHHTTRQGECTGRDNYVDYDGEVLGPLEAQAWQEP